MNEWMEGCVAAGFPATFNLGLRDSLKSLLFGQNGIAIVCLCNSDVLSQSSPEVPTALFCRLNRSDLS